MRYEEEYESALNDPQSYWAAQTNRIAWYKKPESILSKTDFGTFNWYADGELNSCYLALDRHVENGLAEQVALYYDSPEVIPRKP